MATPTLPSASSVVDFLKTQKQDSSFSARRKLFNDLGFNKRLGEFQGTSGQNMALLKELQRTSPGNMTTPPTNELLSGVDVSRNEPPFTATEIMARANTPVQNPASVATSIAPIPTPNMNLSKAFDTFGLKMGGQTTPATLFKPNTPPAPAAPAPATPVVEKTPVVDETIKTDTTFKGAGTPSQQIDTTTKESIGISASDIYPDIFKEADASEGDLLNKFLNSAEGQNLISDTKNKNLSTEATKEAAKQAFESKFQADKTNLEEKLAAHGLAFSGIRGSQVKSLSDNLAASVLGVDRELASALLESDVKLRDAILKGVADLAKDAQDGRKEAIQQLNAIGYAVVGNKLVPTLSALAGERAQRSLELSEERLKLAEAAAARAEGGNKLTLSELKSLGLPLSLVGQSEKDIAFSFYSPKPPQWFVDKVNNEARQNVLPSVVQKLWDEASPAYQESVQPKTPTATVIGNVRALKAKNAPTEDIDNYIKFSGFDPKDPAFK